ncbi:MAG: tRNA (adenosine(37)-N6)-threonylcarbamoyltransferase complex transferase subunit TsaD [Bacteroidota bacterium]
MFILALESSCDETAVAILRDREILANLVSSQLATHQPFGGVVPELAARMHLEALRPLLDEAFAQAGMDPGRLDMVCATRGPGLIGALLVGFSAAKAIAWAADKPFVGVNHIVAHIYANFIGGTPPAFPLLCLTVSGGHTGLYYMTAHHHLEALGQTRDDAAGECLDKAARVLGLGYPGGPAIESAARDGTARFSLPSPAIDGGLDFSFSGLKTAVVNLCHRLEARGETIPRSDLAASLQEAVVDGLLKQLRRAVQATGVKTVLLAGGVSANQTLQARTAAMAAEVGAVFHAPPRHLCTDNAAMVACAGYHRFLCGGADGLGLGVDPDLRL